MYIFGGNTPYGLQNDLWKFNFNLLQWIQVDANNHPEAVYRFGFTSYVQNNSTYFAVFGGKVASQASNSLHVFSVKTQSWTVFPGNGDLPPGLIFPCLEYYNGVLYLACGMNPAGATYDDMYVNSTYSYDLSLKKWEKLSLAVDFDTRTYADSAVVGNFLYIIYGYNNYNSTDVPNIQKLNLNNPVAWEEFDLQTTNPPIRDSFSASASSSSIYLTAGYNAENNLNLNDLVEISIATKQSNILTGLTTNPSDRMFHSMQTINGEFYIFGGYTGGSITDELWKFSPDTETWDILMPLGTTPPSRYMHASGSQGDIMVIWGGQGDSQYLGDMHYYNVQTQTWTEITAVGTTPTPRSGACLAMVLPFVIIFGGETNEGLTNEVWVYDTGSNSYELYSQNDQNVDVMMLQVCEAETIGNDIILYTMTGDGIGEEPLLDIQYFNLTSRTWTMLYNGASEYDKTKTSPIAKKLGNTFLIIGGETWATDAWNNVILAQPAVENDNEIAISQQNYSFFTDSSDSIAPYIWGSAFVYYKNIIYSHGGGGQLGGSTRTNVAHSKMYKMNITTFCASLGNNCTASCSPGTFNNNGICEQCPKGNFSENYGQPSCTPCPPGTYNEYAGANTIRQCYPCPAGTFNNLLGAGYCFECPPGYSCPSGSQVPSLNDLVAEIVSVQPLSFSKNSAQATSDNNILYYTFLAFCLTSLILVLVFQRKLFPVIVKMDLYTSVHNYDKEVPLMLMKTFLGGVFSLIFLLLAILLVISSIIDFEYNNTQESKTLVPLVVMEDEVQTFYSVFYLDLVFLRYGGQCVDSAGACSNMITLSEFEIQGQFVQHGCSLSSENDCLISYTCQDCSLNPGAYVTIVASEKTSYASAISVNITADSSIENANSSLFILVKTPENAIFRGSVPTVFQISAIPSLYRSGITGNDQTGYHLSVNSQPVPGSYYSTYEIAFTANLEVQINLQLTDSSLFTLRYQDVSEIIFVNGLLGSVFGIMGAIRVLLMFVEIMAIKMDKEIVKRKNRMGVEDRRRHIEDQMNMNIPIFQVKTSDRLSLRDNGGEMDS